MATEDDNKIKGSGSSPEDILKGVSADNNTNPEKTARLRKFSVPSVTTTLRRVYVEEGIAAAAQEASASKDSPHDAGSGTAKTSIPLEQRVGAVAVSGNLMPFTPELAMDLLTAAKTGDWNARQDRVISLDVKENLWYSCNNTRRCERPASVYGREFVKCKEYMDQPFDPSSAETQNVVESLRESIRTKSNAGEYVPLAREMLAYVTNKMYSAWIIHELDKKVLRDDWDGKVIHLKVIPKSDIDGIEKKIWLTEIRESDATDEIKEQTERIRRTAAEIVRRFCGELNKYDLKTVEGRNKSLGLYRAACKAMREYDSACTAAPLNMLTIERYLASLICAKREVQPPAENPVPSVPEQKHAPVVVQSIVPHSKTPLYVAFAAVALSAVSAYFSYVAITESRRQPEMSVDGGTVLVNDKPWGAFTDITKAAGESAKQEYEAVFAQFRREHEKSSAADRAALASATADIAKLYEALEQLVAHVPTASSQPTALLSELDALRSSIDAHNAALATRFDALEARSPTSTASEQLNVVQLDIDALKKSFGEHYTSLGERVAALEGKTYASPADVQKLSEQLTLAVSELTRVSEYTGQLGYRLDEAVKRAAELDARLGTSSESLSSRLETLRSDIAGVRGLVEQQKKDYETLTKRADALDMQTRVRGPYDLFNPVVRYDAQTEERIAELQSTSVNAIIATTASRYDAETVAGREKRIIAEGLLLSVARAVNGQNLADEQVRAHIAPSLAKLYHDVSLSFSPEERVYLRTAVISIGRSAAAQK